jgi:diguanylate cyclase (GGDEF)-like protein
MRFASALVEMRGLNKLSVFLLSVLGIIVVGALDLCLDTTQHYSFLLTSTYLVPIAFAAWAGGPKMGFFFALLALSIEIGVSYQAIVGRHPQYLRILFILTLVEGAEMVGTSLLISWLRHYVDQVVELTIHDPLTGVLNISAFEKSVDNEIERMKRFESLAPMCVLFIDIDDFKNINDKHGHRMGDRVLQSVAHVLSASVRRVDSVGRLGGDEFAVLLPTTTSESAEMIARRIEKATADVCDVHVTLSIGIGCFPTAPKNTDAAMRLADKAMYKSKADGKHRHTVFVEG